jgi:cyclopropane-fatty-acyl-phospholipid synthase
VFPLDHLLARLIRVGKLKVLDHRGRPHVFGSPVSKRSVTIRITDPSWYWRIALNPDLNIGRAYTEGAMLVEEGRLVDVLDILLANQSSNSRTWRWNAHRMGQEAVRLPAVINLPARSRRNVSHHYDHPAEFYRCFLDEDLQYSCAYMTPGNDLDRAQLAKKRHISSKLALKPEHRVLDIGCGFGGLALYLAKYHGVHVTGVTLSKVQLEVARRRAAEERLTDLIDFRLQDYRHLEGTFDRIVSVGMFEHVGRPHYQSFFARTSELLAPDGVFLLHTIGRNGPPSPINIWLRQNIFPGAYLPSLSQLVPILERLEYWLADFENLREHYALTLAEWHRRFMINRARVSRIDPERYDERFLRMWEFYLQGCEAGFRHSRLTVFQLLLTKQMNALPITRDYMSNAERRLMVRENAGTEQPRMAGE